VLRRLSVFLVVCCFAQFAPAATVLVFGDSLSAGYGLRVEDGWVHLLQSQLKEHEFINASISGETTGNGLPRLAPLLQEHQPDVLVLELGANDGLRGFPIAVLRNNLQAMIDLGKQFHCRMLLLGVRIPPNYGPRYTQSFADVFQSLADKNAIPVVPFFLQAIAGDADNFQADHLHPNAAAQPKIAATVLPALKPLLEQSHAK
jgi:acyl-CoA thioesterase-1